MNVNVHPAGAFADEVSSAVRALLPAEGLVIVTGGSTARDVYPSLTSGIRWEGIDIAFTDERAVPPDHEDSNYRLVHETLLGHVHAHNVYRIHGEDPPEEAARDYEDRAGPALALGADLLLLGLGKDAHIAGLFPGSPALTPGGALCAAIERPDGMSGVTLAPAAILAARSILVVASGAGKSRAVARSVAGREEPSSAPARLLAGHPGVTFMVDEDAAADLPSQEPRGV